ncbi:PI-PLC X domain-containing protein 1-like [Rhynchophorus ferrugineus]|uniref:PI-PLC X domain-containing protein 1-like n=1 Tax=Rhynchophorus ferrugineus TaxID=354439 RepID=UPI003FCD72D2
MDGDRPMREFLLLVCLVISTNLRSIAGSVPQAVYYQLGSCGKVHLTVSPMQDNYFELNWMVKDCNENNSPDYIIFSNEDPRNREEERSAILKEIRASEHPTGYYKTKFKFREPWLPGNWEYNPNTVNADIGPHCLPFWITSKRNNQTIDTRCLEIQPTWMQDNREYLANQRIGNVFIPGTHNSGSYSGIIAVFEGYVLNQDRDVWNQLVFGNRYLDLRIGHMPDKELYIYHDNVRIGKVEPVLRQIQKFAELAPQEVIIVDIHRFPFPKNFTREMHHKFVRLLQNILGNHIFHSSSYENESGPTFSKIWSTKRSIIISYADSLVINDYQWLWPPIKQFWGNTNQVSELRNYLRSSIYEHVGLRRPLWALMAELTPQTWDVILRKNNLRVLAQKANKEVTKWFRDEWCNRTNIVASDYFLGNDLIRVAIETNKAKGLK